MHDPIGTCLIGEEVVHRSSTATHLPKAPLQNIGGPNGLPELLVKIVVVETAEEVLSHAPDSSPFLDKPSGLPALETPEGLLAAACSKDELGLLETVRAIDLSDLYGHIAHLMGHTTLPFDEGIDTLYGLQQGRVSVADNELEALAMKSPTLEIRKKSSPGSLILHLRELEAEDLLVSLIFLLRPLAVNGKGTEHDLLGDTDLPNLLANAIQKEKFHRVINGSVLEAFELLIQRGQGGAYRLGTDLLAIELFGNAFELTGAHTIEEQSADSTIHIPATPLVAVKDAEFHAPSIHPRHLDIIDRTESCQKISHVMTVAIASATLGPHVPPSTNLSGEFLSQEILNERFDETLYS